jgi:hypothetical protein
MYGWIVYLLIIFGFFNDAFSVTQITVYRVE